MKHSRPLLLICLGALVLRLALLMTLVHHPGIADPNHYYNMGRRIVEGHGLTIDYIWQYNLPPAAIEHPEEHWMPLPAILAAMPMALLDTASPRAALLPFVLLGALLPAISYWAARTLWLKRRPALFAAGAAALLPEFVLNSLRTDTTLPAAVCISLAVLALIRGLESGRARWFILSGLAGGLGYLTRSDAALLLPMLAVTVALYLVLSRRTAAAPAPQWRWVWLMPLVALLVVSPYLIRNVQAFGRATTPEGTRMFFFTHHDDHYAYEREFSLATLLAAQTPGQIIGKRLFEMAAGLRQMIISLDLLAPLVLGGGLLLLLGARRDPEDRARLRTLAPVLILLLGAYIAYTVFIPYKSQAGSFKKAYLMTLPLLLPLAGLALERLIVAPVAALASGAPGTNETRWPVFVGAGALMLLLVGLNAFALVRDDASFTDRYVASIEQIADVARTLPDTNGDGGIVLMVQDPYMLRYAGIRSVIYPYEPIDTIYTVAQRYGVDYLLMPPNRPALDPIYAGEADDARFTLARVVGGTSYVFYRVN